MINITRRNTPKDLKHYVFSQNGKKGRFAICIDADWVTLKQICGHAPPAGLLEFLFDLDPIEWRKTRRNKFAVVETTCPYGSRTRKLIECCDEIMGDFPTRARLHVSMYGKLNAGFSMWIGDLAEILFDMEYPRMTACEYTEVPVHEYSWIRP